MSSYEDQAADLAGETNEAPRPAQSEPEASEEEGAPLPEELAGALSGLLRQMMGNVHARAVVLADKADPDLVPSPSQKRTLLETIITKLKEEGASSGQWEGMPTMVLTFTDRDSVPQMHGLETLTTTVKDGQGIMGDELGRIALPQIRQSIAKMNPPPMGTAFLFEGLAFQDATDPRLKVLDGRPDLDALPQDIKDMDRVVLCIFESRVGTTRRQTFVARASKSADGTHHHVTPWIWLPGGFLTVPAGLLTALPQAEQVVPWMRLEKFLEALKDESFDRGDEDEGWKTWRPTLHVFGDWEDGGSGREQRITLEECEVLPAEKADAFMGIARAAIPKWGKGALLSTIMTLRIDPPAWGTFPYALQIRDDDGNFPKEPLSVSMMLVTYDDPTQKDAPQVFAAMRFSPGRLGAWTRIDMRPELRHLVHTVSPIFARLPKEPELDAPTWGV